MAKIGDLVNEEVISLTKSVKNWSLASGTVVSLTKMGIFESLVNEMLVINCENGVIQFEILGGL